SHDSLGIRIVRVHEQGDHLRLGNQLVKQLKPLRIHLDGKEGDAREIAARPGETGNESVRDRIVTADEDDWDRRGRTLRRKYPKVAPGGRDYADLAGDEVGGYCGQPIVVALRPAVFDREILPLDVAGVA